MFQILMNMKLYKQYLPSSLTERHTREEETKGDDEQLVCFLGGVCLLARVLHA